MPTPTMEEVDTDTPSFHSQVKMEQGEHAGNAGLEEVKKHGRHRSRKSKLYEAIRKQMEFYFSDSNLTKQRVMKDIVQASEYVPLNIFAEKFNKMAQISKNVDDIRRALKKSEKLELSEDGTGVKRKVPFDESKVKDEQAVENCTIYVENIPSHVNHEWIEKIFQEFGQVAYVSLPKFKQSKEPKGFAFVEFEEEEAAKRCLEAFGEMGGCLPTTIEPSSLMSITSFNVEKSETNKSHGNPRKRTRTEVDGEDHAGIKEESMLEKKLKIDDIEKPREKGSNDRLKETNVVEHEPNKATEIKLESEETSDTGGKGGIEDSTKVEKKNKKRRKNRSKGIPENDEKLESDLIHLKILPKRNWRQLRNRYLNLQRENFSKLKAQIKSHGGSRFAFEPQKTSSGQYKSVCVKIMFGSPCESRQSLVSQISTELAPSDWPDFVKYVDYEEGSLEGVVRLNGTPGAGPAINSFVQKASAIFQKATVMTEAETDIYWAASKAKLKEKKKAKIRGKDRLLSQATKCATSHIHFEDAEQDKK